MRYVGREEALTLVMVAVSVWTTVCAFWLIHLAEERKPVNGPCGPDVVVEWRER